MVQTLQVCYNQHSPILYPTKSKTYGTIPGSSSKCQSLVDSNPCSNNTKQTCEYTIIYGHKSTSQGDFSIETFTLKSKNGSPISFPNIVIGCGHNNTLPFMFTEPNAGTIGLIGGHLSLITQMGSSIGGKFSYCLVPMFLDPNTSSELNFCDAAIVSRKGAVSTPIVQGLLILEAFSVGNKRIEFGNSSSGSIQEGNTLIDSGTTISFLLDDVYYILEQIVKDVVKLNPIEDPTQLGFSLCYETTTLQLLVMRAPCVQSHAFGTSEKEARMHLECMQVILPFYAQMEVWFIMLPGERILDLQKRFTHLTNHLIALGKEFTNKDLNLKVLRSLTRA
ncbi:aspartic proteinase CDR1-like [Lotus japonicus]|uniref:aspartic proteinase CDR1-like n=1 Tax=Lotus japonicus TaxID=34305 RepID=UPI00258CDDA1|nr:aspartic proteinase CDR1-like [Lotus japonicus]